MKKNVIKQLIAIVISCVLLPIFGAAEEAERLPDDLDLNGSDCIWIRTIRDYTPLSRDSLLIHASGKRSYFVRLLTPSFGLKSSFQLGTRSRDDQLCPYGGDSLIFDDGKKGPSDTEDPALPEVTGAEVEELG
jgi:hypothetical protein